MAEGKFGWVDEYKLVHPQKRAFLFAYGMGLTIGDSCDKAGIGRQTHYGWLKRDHDEQESYISAFEDAKERHFEALEREARRRAVDGAPCAIFNKDGVQIGTELKYSDTLLIFLMKGAKPDVYRDNYHMQVSGNLNFTAEFESALEKALKRSGDQV